MGFQDFLWECDLKELYKARKTVFHRDIQILRRELKIRYAVECFFTKFKVFCDIVT